MGEVGRWRTATRTMAAASCGTRRVDGCHFGWRSAPTAAAVVLILAAPTVVAAGAQEPAPREPDPIEAGVAPPPGVYAPGVDVVHYDVEIGLREGTPRFAGVAELRIAVGSDGPVLPLDLTGLAVTDVRLAGDPAEHEHVAGVLRIPLSDHDPGDTVTVRVAYEGVPDDGLLLRDNVHGEPAAFVDNWPNRTRFWLPSVDHPTDKATVRYTVHAPARWRVIANGALVDGPTPSPDDAVGPPGAGERRTWIWEVGVPISTYNMVIGAAEMEVRTVGLAACGRAPASRREDGCVEVTYWVFPQDVEKAEPSFRRAAEMVDHFTELVGPFPFEKLANVQSATRFGGMENASAIFYSEQAIAAGRDIEGTVSHEIAHQWFGDAVTEESWHHLWLSEGFATYFGAQFFEAADGVDSFRARMEQSRQRVVASPDSERPVYDPAETDLFALLNTNNYPKGGWVLHMLRGILGDETFFEGIRDYYRTYLHSVALTEDFKRVMETASGRDLDWFFAQWIYRPGFPAFEVHWRWIPAEDSERSATEDAASGALQEAGGGAVEVTVRQVQRESWPTFRVPTELAVIGPGGETRHEVELLLREETFRIDGIGARPSEVVLDPDGWVLKGDGG